MERVPSQASQPQFLPARTYRPSAASTSSRFRRPTQDPKSTATSPNPALKTFVVPLFFSNSSVQNDTSAHGALPASTRSRASTRSVIEDAVTGADGVRPLSVPRDSQSEYSDMYGGSLHQPERPEPVPLARNMDDEPTPSERQALRAYQSRSSTRSSRRSSKKHGVFSRKSYRDPDVSSKARISFAFGVTLVVALVLYLVLASTGVARNLTFHVISILFLLALTGVFFHQLIRMFMLIRNPRGSRHRTTHAARRHHARHAAQTRRDRPRKHVEPETIPEKPIPIHMASDTSFGPDVEAHPVIQPPPPVYGNVRDSMRINPDYVHWREVPNKPPSPLTPTYDEAMRQVHQTMGYRPPSYLSEAGNTAADAGPTRTTTSTFENIHPLERERMRNLAAEALEGRA